MVGQIERADGVSAGRGRPGRYWLAFLGAAILVAAAAIWWLAFSPQDSSVRLAQIEPVAAGESMVASGAVGPAGAGRTVTLYKSGSASGPWVSTATATTDGAGQFAVEISEASAGPLWLRADTAAVDRHRAASSQPVKVSVQEVTTLTLATEAKRVRTDGAASFTGVANPGEGAIVVEQSEDGTTWSSSDIKVTSGQQGKFSFKAPKLKGGTWQFRAVISPTETATGARSKAVSLTVEDFKAAGAKYLELIGPYNDAITANNDAINDYNETNSSADQQRVRTTDAALSKTAEKTAAALRSYKYWPQVTTKPVNEMARTLVLEADALNQMSKASSIEERNVLYDSFINPHLEGTRSAVALREALGLPKRK